MHCAHPHREEAEIRRFKFSGGSYFALQCPDCSKRIGPKLEADELGIHPKKVKRAETKKGRTGLGGAGNSKRRDFEARFRAASWKRLRALVLDRDDFTCRNCGEPANEAHHLTYERFGAERLSDLAASCRDCNLAERERRVAG